MAKEKAPKAPKIKVQWRGVPEGVKHALRTVDGVVQDRAVCGAAVRPTWTPEGSRLKKADTQCGKCVKWEPLGMGPGGPNYRAPKKALAGTAA